MEKPLKMIIEALLFAADKPLTSRDIHNAFPEFSPADITAALNELIGDYERMERSFMLKEVAQGYQIRTRSDYAPYVLKMLRSSPARLSRAAMETLAIIAYKQPIIRQEIERFRGVDVGGILRTLLEKDLIRIVGRKDLPGRPLVYGTTRKFLEVFDLKDLQSLPKMKEIEELESDEAQPPQQSSESAAEGSGPEEKNQSPPAGEGSSASTD
ncbi:MAG: SMC-Scp complex subunit ScpB [Desulfatiglandaceae bacterium]